jgi:TMEM175 potassium channel family protein
MDSRPLETGVSKDRTIAFSDGVFAIAITLLVLNVEVPDLHPATAHALRRALDDAVPDLIGYGIGFYVIGKFWLGHHDLFDNLRALTPRMMNVNLVYLATIAVLPFPTGVLGDHGSLTVSVVLFASAVSLAGLCEFLLIWVAYREGLTTGDYVSQRRQHYYESFSVPAVFLLSIPIAVAHPDAAKFFWLLLIPVRFGGARLGFMPGR